ncbi:polymorphic toxin-type HINT domain-containing protein [Streptomyces sp. NPDC020965]|uniref:polymorphic toxin-type HINT domain-containing protein n=1 Tax=Streptomyces sp. NPDC020965 TaxID=3365105 RepID=UPI0037898286
MEDTIEMINGRSMRPFPGMRRRIAVAAAVVMVGTLLQGVTQPAVAADDGSGRPDLPAAESPVAGSRVVGGQRADAVRPHEPRRMPHATWPKAATTRIQLTAGARGLASSEAKDGVPLELDTGLRAGVKPATGAVEARVLSRQAARAAGVEGVLFTLRSEKAGTQGSVRARIDYSGFAEAYGGGYASRLTLVELPACALTTPGVAACRSAKPVVTANDTARRTLTAGGLALRAGAPTVLAAVAGASSGNSDYKATALSASATWNTNLNTGDFSWSYGMPVPQVPGQLIPTVGLSYSSGGIDGRTGNTNNQSSWVGDGFNLWPGSIERRYKPCADDGVKNAQGHKPGDQCWAYDNAFISFNGKAGELVPVGADAFKLREDDGTKIDRLRSANRGNGDNDGEYWRLTMPDGSRYYFGYNRLPGWADGKETTDSTWTVPVFGDDAGEECNGATFAASWCQQAWRWNLDYAVDPHGNAIAYYYTKENNSYGRNLESADNTRYVRGGTIDRIEYGLKSSSMYGTKALARVDFTSAERCLPTSTVDCSSISTQAAHWYDTPWDLNCGTGETCDQGRLSPAFFTRKRMTEVTTQVLDGAAYKDVDTWKLAHHWGKADTDYQLLLSSIQRTGHTAVPAITLPKTTLGYTQLVNRLDRTGDGHAPFVKDRLSTVTDESGGQLDVNYTAPACSWTALPTPETNTTRCFPQYMGGSDTEDPTLQWFNKYVVDSLTETDRTGGAPDKVTQYDYRGGAAWHYDDDDGLTKEKHKTWSQWRGYGHVRVQTGGQGSGPSVMKSQADSYFLRGMDGDRKTRAGQVKDVTITLDEGEGAPLTDHESAAGFTYKTATYSAPGGKVLAKTLNRPWRHETAKKVRDWGTVTANFSGTAEARSLTSLDDGAGVKWRTVSTATSYDTVAGRITEVDDRGNHSTIADNTCTRTTYAATGSDTILGLPSRVETVAKPCGTAPTRPADVLTDVRTAYDGQAYGDVATKGLPTTTAILKEYDGTTAVYLESGGTHDSYGRPVTTTDLTADVRVTAAGAVTRTPRTDGRTTKTERSPATGFVTTLEVTSPPAKPTDPATALTSTTTLDPLRGLPRTQTDANGKATNFDYDALGRSSKVWLADRLTGQTPNFEFAYSTAADKRPIAVSTTSLGNNGTQRTSYALYDGFLRPRQTQEPGPDGGTLISDTFYDERGLTSKTFASYYVTGAPSTRLFQPDNALSVETQSRYTYDGLGRQTEHREIAGNGDGGTVLSTTKTIHGGDRTTVIPPTGGTATTTLTDARGKTTELRQHHQPTADSPYDTTAYAYTPRGALQKVTDPGGSSWTHAYDLLGRQTTSSDPDAGSTTKTYDDRGQVLTSYNDATKVTLASVYDGLGRKTQLRKDSATGPKRAEWTYDTIAGAKGHLAKTTRYENGHAYSSQVELLDRLYRPLRTSVTIPATEGKLAGTYDSSTSYKVSGAVQAVGYPAAGALPASVVSFTHEDATLRPIAISDSQGVQGTTSYSLTGKPLQHELLRDGGKKTWVTNGFEWGSQRLSTTRVDRQDVAGVDQSSTYRYDDAGNVRSVSDVSRSGTDNQCFTYDWARRLTQAWTQPTTTCAASPSANAIGGPAPYWHSYTYNTVGARSTETRHDTTGNTAKDLTRTYEYPAQSEPQPHTLTSVSSAGPVGTPKDSFTYKAGSIVSRTVNGVTQNLDWDAEGHLAKVTEPVTTGPDKITQYIYDAEGSRLIGRTPTETTLYLGSTEITLTKGSTTPKATRYVEVGGGHQAVQENDGSFSFTLADHHGTAQLATDAATQQLTHRRSLPFGGTRGTQPANWPGTKGFVGGTDDTKTTGLTHLGAREYDPSTGRFISVDPLLELDKPQTLNGYTYAAQNPLTFTDPTGLGIGCGPGMMADCPSNDPNGDGVVNPGRPDTNQPGASSNTGSTKPSGGGGGKAPVIRPKGDSIEIAGVYLPTQSELIRDYPNMYDHDRSYQSNLQNWARTMKCSGFENTEACGIMGKLGWFGSTPDADILEILGLRNAADCAQGEGGGSCKRALGDAVVAAAGAGVGKVGSIIFKGIKASLKRGKAVPVQCLVGAAGNSFTAGTLVLMGDGTTKPIEDVKAGDQVLATDPETGISTAQTVTAELVHLDNDLIDLRVRGDDENPAVLKTTAHHPFWDTTTQSWKPAGALTEQSRLATATGQPAAIEAVDRRAGSERMYDLSVADFRTYYVLAGETPVLVHNSNCGIGRELIGDNRSDHILDGHRYPGAGGKDAFPKGWSDDQILDAVADVVTSPNSQRTWYQGSAVHAERTLKTRKGAPAVQDVVGTSGGVRILVRYEPLTGKVLTAFPN